MASRFWVGGSGTWDNANTANWSATSGGAGGASAPTTSDTATFDTNSGAAATITVAATAACSACTVNKSDIILSLAGDATLGAAGNFTLTTGAVQLNTYTLSIGSISTNNSNTRSIDFGTGKIKLLQPGGAWSVTTTTNLTLAGTPSLEFANATATPTTYSMTVAEAVAPHVLVSAGTYAFTCTGTVKDLTFIGFAGSLANGTRTIYGNLTLASGMTTTGGSAVTTFGASSGVKTITCNGAALQFAVVFDGAAAEWSCSDTFLFGSTRKITLTNGTLNANGQNVQFGSFALGVGTKTLTLSSGTWTAAAAGAVWDANTNAAGLTVSASTGVISLTNASAKTFAGGGFAWPTLNQGGAGALTIQQSNTFANITNTVQPATITLTSGTTQTVSAFGVSGTSGNLITLNSSSAGSQATLSDSSGANSVSFVSIKDINATGGAFWSAYTSNGNVDAGNNTGWDFNGEASRYIYTRRKNKVIFPI